MPSTRSFRPSTSKFFFFSPIFHVLNFLFVKKYLFLNFVFFTENFSTSSPPSDKSFFNSSQKFFTFSVHTYKTFKFLSCLQEPRNGTGHIKTCSYTTYWRAESESSFAEHLPHPRRFCNGSRNLFSVTSLRFIWSTSNLDSNGSNLPLIRPSPIPFSHQAIQSVKTYHSAV